MVDHVRVESPLVTRVAGVPAAALNRLRFEQTFGRVNDVLRLEDWVRIEAESLVDILHEIIGELSDPTLKPGLVGLRRALHQRRRPRSAEWHERIRAALPLDLADRIAAWINELAAGERQRVELPEVLAAEATDKQAILREIARDPRFQRALLSASSDLFKELAKWLDDERRVPRRQTVVRLAKYVARAAAKTSPYSTFTVSGVGVWTNEGPAARFDRSHAVRGVLEFNGALLHSLIQSHIELSPSLRLRVNPSLTVSGDRLSFIGRPPEEPIVTMGATPAVRECLRLSNEDITLPELSDRLAAAGGAPRDAVERFLRGLLNAGLLELRAPVADQSEDPLADLANWVGTDQARPLRRVREELRRPVAVEDVDGERARQASLHQAISELPGEVATGKWAVHENAVFPRTPVECALPAWRPVLDDLNAVRRWLAARDQGLPLRLALGAYCRERFGQGSQVPLLALHHSVQAELTTDPASRYGAAGEVANFLKAPSGDLDSALAASPLPRLRELAWIRREAREALLTAAKDADGTLRVDPEKVVALADQWPDWITPVPSLGCYLQLLPGDECSAVLNVAHAGYGRGRTRVNHLVRQAGGAPPPVRWRARGPVLAEFGGRFASSLNTRDPSVPYEIDYPFTTSARDAAERIPPSDLMACHDSGADLVRLHSTRLGSPVLPVHLGNTSDVLLPPLARLMTLGFGPGYLVHPSVPLLAGADTFTVPAGVVAQPRVAIGQVIVRRAGWVVPTIAVPSRPPGQTDAGYLLEMLKWLRGNGIPTQCFVRVWNDSLRDEQNARPDRWVLDKSRKPVYVDFASWFLVLGFERMLRDAGPIALFEEALPPPGEAMSPEDEPAVTEFLVEISEPGGHHE